MSNQYAGEFLKADIDDASDIDVVKSVRSLPTFIFYKDGNKIDSFTTTNPSVLDDKIRANQ